MLVVTIRQFRRKQSSKIALAGRWNRSPASIRFAHPDVSKNNSDMALSSSGVVGRTAKILVVMVGPARRAAVNQSNYGRLWIRRRLDRTSGKPVESNHFHGAARLRGSIGEYLEHRFRHIKHKSLGHAVTS
jgi:hypothetical protein